MKSKSYKEKSKGFTIIELLIVIAILGVLLSIALPAYVGYLKKSKIKTVEENFNIAVNYVRAELAKKVLNPQQVTTDVVSDLNKWGKTSPFDPSAPAFSTSINAPGQVMISPTDLKNASLGSTVTIKADLDGDGTADSNFQQTIVIE